MSLLDTHKHTHTNTGADTPGAEQGTDCPLPLLSHYIRACGSFGSVRAVPPQTDSDSNKTAGIKVGRQVREAACWILAGVTCVLLRCHDPHALSGLVFNQDSTVGEGQQRQMERMELKMLIGVTHYNVACGHCAWQKLPLGPFSSGLWHWLLDIEHYVCFCCCCFVWIMPEWLLFCLFVFFIWFAKFQFLFMFQKLKKVKNIQTGQNVPTVAGCLCYLFLARIVICHCLFSFFLPVTPMKLAIIVNRDT